MHHTKVKLGFKSNRLLFSLMSTTNRSIPRNILLFANSRWKIISRVLETSCDIRKGSSHSFWCSRVIWSSSQLWGRCLRCAVLSIIFWIWDTLRWETPYLALNLPFAWTDIWIIGVQESRAKIIDSLEIWYIGCLSIIKERKCHWTWLNFWRS